MEQSLKAKTLIIFFFLFLSIHSAASNSIQIGECQRLGMMSLESCQSFSQYPITLEFRCFYKCLNLEESEDIVEAHYEVMVENDSEIRDKYRCEGEGKAQGIFFSRLSKSKDLKRWANDNRIPFEGPYKGELTQETLRNLLEVGRKLAATKSIITSRAGEILIKIGLQTEEGQKLFQEFLLELRSSSFQPHGMQTPKDWVRYYIIKYGQHLY